MGLLVFRFSFLVALIGAILLQTLRANLKSVKWIVVCGLSLGIVLPVFGGYWLWIGTPGFESLAILVGALAGWILGRSEVADRKA
jgi:hypothetical protein